MRILLIEDDADLFSLLKYNLEKEGFSLSGQHTGKGAIELCRQVRPDLILLDCTLPSMSCVHGLQNLPGATANTVSGSNTSRRRSMCSRQFPLAGAMISRSWS